MVSSTRSLRGVALGLVLAAGVLACSSDDGGTGPTISAPLGEFSTGLGEASTTYLVPNAAAFASVEFFSPYIGGVFPAPPSPSTVQLAPRAALQTCLPAEVLGITFDFNEQASQYEPTQATGAPADGFRLLLYRVQSGAVVVPKEQIGYLDLSCPSDLPAVDMTVSVVVNSVEVMHLNAVGSVNVSTEALNLSIPITLRTPTGSASLEMLSTFSGVLTSYTGGITVPVRTDLEVGYSRTVAASAITSFVSGVGGNPEVQLDWTFFLGMDVTSGNIVGEQGIGAAPATFNDYESVSVVACFSGAEESPTVTDATVGEGCPAEPATPVRLSSQELQALRTAFLTMRGLYRIAGGFWEVALQLLAP